jgi:hypothetical protein
MKDLLEIALSGFWPFVGATTLAILVCDTIARLTRTVFLCWNRWLRSRNIKHHGWPPPHCDADGDSST